MTIVMTSTACSPGSGSTTATPESKETTAVQSAEEEKREDTAAAPEENCILMFGHAQTETHPYQARSQEWADAVTEKTNDGLVIDLYPSNTFGSEQDIINSFKDLDTNWGYNTDLARLGTYVPELAMFKQAGRTALWPGS